MSLQGEGVEGLWSVLILAYYSAVQREEILTHAIAEKNSEDMVHSEISPSTGGHCRARKLE